VSFIFLVIGIGLFLIGTLLFLLLESEVNYPQNKQRISDYFAIHPRRLEVAIQIMLLSFPVSITLWVLPYLNQSNVSSVLGFPIIFMVLWPFFIYGIHIRFNEFAVTLKISSKEIRKPDPFTVAVLYVVGWFIALVGVFVGIILQINNSLSVLQLPLQFGGLVAIFLIPLRKSIATIRNRGKHVGLVDRKVRVIIFDLDGVIRHLDLDTAERAAQSIGFSYDELIQTVWYNEYSFELLCGRSTREEWWSHVSKFDLRLEGLSQDVLWDDVFEISTYDKELIEFVRGIKGKFRVGILTNCDKESKIQILEELGDNHPFDFVFSSSDFGVAKPNPAIFEKLLERIGAKANQCVFFDDAIANVEAAQDVGVHAFLFEDLDHLKYVLESQQ